MQTTTSDVIHETTDGDRTWQLRKHEQSWAAEDGEPVGCIWYVVSMTHRELGTTERARFKEFLDARDWMDRQVSR